MSVKANHRSSYNSSVSKQKQNTQNAFFLSETNFITIYHAQLFDKYLLLCTKKSISIYNTQTFIKEYQINVQTHFACFIPFTTLLVYPKLEDNAKKVLVFWNYKTKKVQAQITLNFQIQTIKASRRCISLANLQHLYVIHFPSLKPIYQGFAGNGFKVVYDISREGLTIAHQTPKKGELAIKNFTNIRTNKLLLDINSRSRTQSLGKLLREQTFSKVQQQAQEQIQQDIKKQHYIKAHNENINLIRLSPNGYRVITASTKGAIVRLFSTLNGQLISEFRMSNDISNVVDACFNNEGSQIVCLNQNNQVNLFQARMSEVELLSESSRRGVQIYQMKNPSSFFSFLGFLNIDLKNQYPFSYFKLDTKGIEIKQKREKLEAQLDQKDQKQKNNYITEIKEVHQSLLQAQSEVVVSNQSIAPNQQTINIRINNKQPSQVPEKFKSIHLQQVDVTFMSPKTFIEKKSSLSGVSKFESIKSRSIDSRNKQGSLKSLGKISKKPTEVVKFGQKESDMHFKGIINFGDITNVKVLQSKYYFQLKYDPFNGGKMIQKTGFNILKHPRLSDL